MLHRQERKQIEQIARREQGESLFAVLILFALIHPFAVDFEKPGKLEHAARCPKRIARYSLLGGRCCNINRGSVENRRSHLAGQKPLPDKVVEPQHVVFEQG